MAPVRSISWFADVYWCRRTIRSSRVGAVHVLKFTCVQICREICCSLVKYLEIALKTRTKEGTTELVLQQGSNEGKQTRRSYCDERATKGRPPELIRQ